MTYDSKDVPGFCRSAEATALRLLMAMSNPHGYKAKDLQFLATDKNEAKEGKGNPPSTPDELDPDDTSSVGDHQSEMSHQLLLLSRSNSSTAGGSHEQLLEEENSSFSTQAESMVGLRGNESWAPPRPQLILQINKKKK